MLRVIDASVKWLEEFMRCKKMEKVSIDNPTESSRKLSLRLKAKVLTIIYKAIKSVPLRLPLLLLFASSFQPH